MIVNRVARLVGHTSTPMAFFALLLATLLLLVPMPALANDSDEEDARTIFNQCISWYEDYAANYAESGVDFPVAGDSGSDWIAIAMGISGNASVVSGYLDELETYVTEAYASQGALSATSQTDYDRIILVVWALGGDPTSFGIDAAGDPINLLDDGIFYWSNPNGIDVQGLTADIWALIALDAGGYEEPEDAIYTRDILIDNILAAQADDGSFGLSANGNSSGDISITAMALQALAPYISERSDVSLAVEEVLTYLSDVQGANGVFADYGSENSESTAQVIVGLCAVGVDPRTNSMFVKDGGNAYDALLKFRNDDGSFNHIAGSPGLGGYIVPTEQAMLALLAVDDYDYGNGIIYEPATIDEGGSGSASSAAAGGLGELSTWGWVLAVVVAVILIVLAVFLTRKRAARTTDSLDVKQTDPDYVEHDKASDHEADFAANEIETTSTDSNNTSTTPGSAPPEAASFTSSNSAATDASDSGPANFQEESTDDSTAK